MALDGADNYGEVPGMIHIYGLQQAVTSGRLSDRDRRRYDNDNSIKALLRVPRRPAYQA